jgi:hypothetical protein
MLIVVSDLHLTDVAARSTFDALSFGHTLRSVVRVAAAERADEVRLILLGDVFEILKSTLWLERDVRPWERPTDRHRHTVAEIVRRILSVNRDFFSELNAIRGEHANVRLTYVIGNHDRPLNTEMGSGSREVIRRDLGIQGGDGLFPDSYEDAEHSVLAQHGHHWDAANRYRGASIAIGDAIVIDVVARLPIVFAERLGIDPDDPRLRFVHEIDNIIPQTPGALARPRPSVDGMVCPRCARQRAEGDRQWSDAPRFRLHTRVFRRQVVGECAPAGGESRRNGRRSVETACRGECATAAGAEGCV